MRKQKITISVIGGHSSNAKVEQLAYKIGEIIARNECITVCGGLGGVMEAVALSVRLRAHIPWFIIRKYATSPRQRTGAKH